MLNMGRSRGKKRIWLDGILMMAILGSQFARAADNPIDNAGPTPPAEPGFRLTPGLARGMAACFARDVLMGRYDLPEDKLAEAGEKIARRIMQMAHNIEEPGGELIERFIEEQLAGQVRGEDHSFVPRNFAKEFSDRILPLIPEIREMVQGAVHDIRSMLPMKKQLQLAGEMMGFQTAVDAFEETMKKWSSGEVANYDDPFHQQRMEKNEKGETQGLRWARQMAENGIRQSHGKEWKRYVDKFKALYKLDAAQMATAESMLREYVDREQTITAESGWKQRIYRDQLWLNLSYHLPQGRDNPACALFEDDLASAKAPFERLDEEFKMRLESIPTDDQRRIADEMITKLLKNKGLEAPDARPESASSRAEPTESEP